MEKVNLRTFWGERFENETANDVGWSEDVEMSMFGSRMSNTPLLAVFVSMLVVRLFSC